MTDAITGAALLRMWERGSTYDQLSEITGLTRSAVAGRIWRHNRQVQRSIKSIAPRDLYNNPLPPMLHLDGDWMLTGDVHTPTMDYDMVGLVGAVAEKHGVKNLLVAGDLLNNDVFSVHPKIDEGIPWEREKVAARELLREWAGQFDRIVWSSGNHERRLSRKTWGALRMVDLRDIVAAPFIDRIEFTERGYVIIDTPNGEWRITHPRNYSQIPLRTANRLAMKWGQHVVTFHEHHLGMGWCDNGRNIIANAGGLHDKEQLSYVRMDDTTMPEMNAGFGMLKDGYLSLYGESPFTNWEEVLG